MCYNQSLSNNQKHQNINEYYHLQSLPFAFSLSRLLRAVNAPGILSYKKNK